MLSLSLGKYDQFGFKGLSHADTEIRLLTNVNADNETLTIKIYAQTSSIPFNLFTKPSTEKSSMKNILH